MKLMKNNQYQLALIGYGGMGHWHVQSLQNRERIRVCGIFDTDPGKLTEAESNGYHAYGSFDEVLRDPDVDILLLTVPNDWHKPYAIRALRAGKNVISEKPVTLSSTDLAEMIKTADETKHLFTVHQNRRWDEDFLTMKKIYDEGLLGDVFSIESRVHGSRGIPGDWRGKKEHGGGMMLDWGVHILDQMLQMVREKITYVYAHMHHVTNYEVDDGFRMVITFESGKEALLEVGTSNFINLPRWYMQGENGTALMKDFGSDAEIVNITDWSNADAVPVRTAAGLTKTMAPRTDETIHRSVLSHVHADVFDFYRNVMDVLDGKAESVIRHDELMRVMRLMEAAFESDRTHEIVRFE